MAPPEEIGQPLERSVRKRPTDERSPTTGAPGSANVVFHPCLLYPGSWLRSVPTYRAPELAQI
jgi:hypothetical protein